MNLQAYVEDQLADRKVLLMTHVIAGFPSLEANWRMLELMAEVGVDLVELQMPFSEPVADGQGFAAIQQIGEKGAGLGGDLISFLIGPPIKSANDLMIGGRDH